MPRMPPVFWLAILIATWAIASLVARVVYWIRGAE